MRFIRIISAILSAIILCSCFTACGEDYKEAFIYIDFDAKPTSLDPQLADSDEELTVVRSLFDTLLRYDENGNIVCSGAESYTKEGNTYTFKLNKKAKWVDGDNLTANDYVFGFRRAVDPETKAPFANSLFSIVNAKDIYNGSKSVSALGVTAIDDYTLKIELTGNDAEFEKVLTTAVTMPCNEKYFTACKGKYGLTLDTTPSCGSYYIRQWLTETKFLIRLAKNLDFKGAFEANSMRIYFTCGEDNAIDMLNLDNTDLAYISTDEYTDINSAGFKVVSVEDTCYTVFLSERMDADLRRAFLSSISSDTFKDNLLANQRVAETLYPDILAANGATKAADVITHDITTALDIFATKTLEGVIPENISIKYPADTTAESVARSLAAHWQQTLSCFMNIEETPIYTVRDMFFSTYYDIIIIPFSAPTGTVSAYNKKLGFEDSTPSAISEELFGNYRCYPLYFSSLNVAAGAKIQNLDAAMQGGIIDVSILIKMQ
ncbi:MAG: hypothetical protein IIX54_03685 [Clostridia bacterium]|nr:hypothetical protein [Clostridia bacterium]